MVRLCLVSAVPVWSDLYWGKTLLEDIDTSISTETWSYLQTEFVGEDAVEEISMEGVFVKQCWLCSEDWIWLLWASYHFRTLLAIEVWSTAWCSRPCMSRKSRKKGTSASSPFISKGKRAFLLPCVFCATSPPTWGFICFQLWAEHWWRCFPLEGQGLSVQYYLNHPLNPGFLSAVAIQALIAFD